MTCSGCAARVFPATYYLALGDSLSQGVQPDAAGGDVETGQGYADQLYAALLPAHPGLRLVKLGCPGETSKTMIDGGICRYPGGSQLAAAVAFLRAHRGRMFLITIDIGANDPEDCGSESMSPSMPLTAPPAVSWAAGTGQGGQLRAARPAGNSGRRWVPARCAVRTLTPRKH